MRRWQVLNSIWLGAGVTTPDRTHLDGSTHFGFLAPNLRLRTASTNRVAACRFTLTRRLSLTGTILPGSSNHS